MLGTCSSLCAPGSAVFTGAVQAVLQWAGPVSAALPRDQHRACSLRCELQCPHVCEGLFKAGPEGFSSSSPNPHLP